MRWSQGFTVVELAVTIVVVGVLAAMAVYLPSQYLVQARDQERYDDVSSIAIRLEQAYTEQALTVPSYPATTTLLSAINTESGVVKGTDSNIFLAPDATMPSVSAATSASDVNPSGGGSPTVNQYIYQPFRSDGGLCSTAITASDPTTFCTRFTLFYRTEFDDTVQKIRSLHQQ